MSEIPQLAELARRKRMLLVSSALERQVVAVRWEEAEERAQWVEQGIEAARQVKPWLKIGLPLLAAFRWRKKGLKEGAKASVSGIGRLVSWVRRGLSVWAVVQQMGNRKVEAFAGRGLFSVFFCGYLPAIQLTEKHFQYGSNQVWHGRVARGDRRGFYL